MDMFSVRGKVAIVTGASRGLGRHMALGLSEAGAHVVLVARDEEKLKDVAAGSTYASTTPASSRGNRWNRVAKGPCRTSSTPT